MDAYELIRSAILEGEYNPEQRLTEEALAATLGMSRTPIREAIRRLTAEGLVVLQGRRASVREFPVEDVRQIYDLRALLEGYAASAAATHRSDEDLERLHAANRRFARAVEAGVKSRDQIREIVDANHAFHYGVVLATHNAHLDFLISRVVVLPLVFRSFYWYDPREMEVSLGYHQTITSAIEQQDADRARSAMAEHIYKGRDHVLLHAPTLHGSESNEDDEGGVEA